MISAVKRLMGFVCLLVLLGAAVLWITWQSMGVRESHQEKGLRWLKEEYQLDEASFKKALALHEAYFATCNQMCQEINDASRPLLMRSRRIPQQAAMAKGLHDREQRLCDSCEDAAKKHLHKVAELMTPEQGKRFLADMLETLETQRLQHDLDMTARPRR